MPSLKLKIFILCNIFFLILLPFLLIAKTPPIIQVLQNDQTYFKEKNDSGTQFNQIDEIKEKIANYVLQCHKNDGGFSKNINESNSTIQNTFYALLTLYNLGFLNLIDENLTLNFLISAQETDGGFKEIEDTNSSLFTTYQALISFTLLNSIDKIENITNLEEFLNNSQSSDGVFFVNPGSTSYSLDLAYVGLISLMLIDRFDLLKNKSNLVQFVIDCFQTDGGFSQINSTGEPILPIWTNFGISTLSILNETSQVNKSKILEYILSIQAVNGSFNNNILDTAFSIVILESINQLAEINETKSIEYLLDCMGSDGGFFNNPNKIGDHALYYSFSAVISNEILKSATEFEEPKLLNYVWQNFNGSAFSYCYQSSPNLHATSVGLLILNSYDDIDLLNETEIMSYIMNHKGPNGGFRDLDGNESLFETFWVYKTLHSLNKTILLNKTEILDFLLKLNRSDGGFSNYLSIFESNLSHTYRALNILKLLGGTHEIDLNLTYNYILNCQISEGKFANSPACNELFSNYTFFGIKSLELINLLQSFNKSAGIEHLNDFNMVDGGFSYNGITNSTIEDTNYALMSYLTLGEVTLVNKTEVKLFLKSLEIKTGNHLINFLLNYTIIYNNSEIDEGNQLITLYNLINTLKILNIPEKMNLSNQFWLNFWDSEYGGFYSTTNSSGFPLSFEKNTTDQLYGLIGLLRLYELTKDGYFFEEYVIPTINFLENHTWDELYGGLYYSTEKNGSILGPSSEHRKKYSHIQFLGILSFLNLYEITKNISYFQKINQTTDFILTHLWNSSDDYFYCAVDEDGSNKITFKDGYSLALGILTFLKLYQFTKNQTFLSVSENVTSSCMKFLWNSSFSAFVSKLSDNNDVLDSSFQALTQCIFLQDLFMLYEKTGNNTYHTFGTNLLNFCFTSLFNQEIFMFNETLVPEGGQEANESSFFTQFTFFNTLQILKAETGSYITEILNFSVNFMNNFTDINNGGVYSFLNDTLLPQSTDKNFVDQILSRTFTFHYNLTDKQDVYFYNFTKIIEIPISFASDVLELNQEHENIFFLRLQEDVISSVTQFNSCFYKMKLSINFSTISEIGSFLSFFSHEVRSVGFELFTYHIEIFQIDYVFLNNTSLNINFGLNVFNLSRELGVCLNINSTKIIPIILSKNNSFPSIPSSSIPLCFYMMGNVELVDPLTVTYYIDTERFDISKVKIYAWNASKWQLMNDQVINVFSNSIAFNMTGLRFIGIFSITSQPNNFNLFVLYFALFIIISCVGISSLNLLSVKMINRGKLIEKMEKIERKLIMRIKKLYPKKEASKEKSVKK